MFLGTPRHWWIAAALPLALGFALLLTGDGTVTRTVVGVLLLLLAMALFGMAPMRYGQQGRKPTPERVAPAAQPPPSGVVPPPRPTIEGRDASEV